jgi:hypothetical protein
MNQNVYALIAGVIFLLIALAHLVRVVFGVPVVVYEIHIPMWASVLAVVLMGYLSYEGFHLARTGRR